MDFEFISNFTPMFVKAGILTLKLAFLGILLSIIIGFLCTYIRYKNVSILKSIVGGYIELSRNTPLLIQLFFLYYGLPKLGLSLSSFQCAVIGLAFLGGSYMSESFRTGFEAIKKAQIESAMSLALSEKQILFYVILPKALAIALPSLSANVIFLLKETSIVSIIALADLVYAAKDVIGIYYKTGEALFMLTVSYIIIILPISLGLTYLEKRLSYARG
ncbi:MAG: amino acid ABC transporter permease [Campylobacter sp.]|nr:amino acid ABC transporter permease [Campylobacter sp.]